jgi:sodium-dependent dicarboxylate transporter 2/3/5
VAFFLLAFLDTPLRHDPEFGSRPAFAAAGAALMGIWWLTEALPIYVTACVPLVLFPLTGVFGGGLWGNVRQSVTPYIDPYIFLFAGGMGIAAAMQQWNLHRRIALGIMDRIGSDPRRLLAGTLVATAFISMWISNTATAAMMMPIGLAVVLQVEDQRGAGRLRHYGMAIMLAIAYGANVGGIGTKIGTAPNAQFSGFMERLGIEITFLQFLAVGLPFVLVFLPVVWWMLWRIGRREGLAGEIGEEVIAGELAKLGPVRRPERIVLGVFLVTAGLWIAGKVLTEFL